MLRLSGITAASSPPGHFVLHASWLELHFSANQDVFVCGRCSFLCHSFFFNIYIRQARKIWTWNASASLDAHMVLYSTVFPQRSWLCGIMACWSCLLENNFHSVCGKPLIRPSASTLRGRKVSRDGLFPDMHHEDEASGCWHARKLCCVHIKGIQHANTLWCPGDMN